MADKVDDIDIEKLLEEENTGRSRLPDKPYRPDKEIKPGKQAERGRRDYKGKHHYKDLHYE